MNRKYLPTLAELVDRLTIVQMKAIFIPENRTEYLNERRLIEHDIDVILQEKEGTYKIASKDIVAMMMIMLTNRYIWENESKARQGLSDQDKLLKLTHSINGIRSTAKNILSVSSGDRIDMKVDCFAAELDKEFGNWNVFGDAQSS